MTLSSHLKKLSIYESKKFDIILDRWSINSNILWNAHTPQYVNGVPLNFRTLFHHNYMLRWMYYVFSGEWLKKQYVYEWSYHYMRLKQKSRTYEYDAHPSLAYNWWIIKLHVKNYIIILLRVKYKYEPYSNINEFQFHDYSTLPRKNNT